MKRFLVFVPQTHYALEPAFRIRLLNLQHPLAQRGFQLDIQPRPKSPWGRWALARSARHYDGVILHRKMLDPYEARTLRQNLPRPKRIFLDIDDATMLHETPLGLIARQRLKRRHDATLNILDLACAGNAHLAQHFHERGIATSIIPSGVDPQAYPLKQVQTGPGTTLVWIGSASTLQYLQASFPALAQAARRTAPLRLVVICNAPPPTLPPIPMDFIPWSLHTQAAALLRGDIGIAPTPDNPWTRGKCGFKIVQYMAAALPVIASPVGFNCDLLRPATGTPAGLLPATWDDWPAAIESLAGNPALRAQLGAAGRQRVEQTLSLELLADRWARALA